MSSRLLIQIKKCTGRVSSHTQKPVTDMTGCRLHSQRKNIIQLLTSDSVPRKVFVTQTSNHSATKLQDCGHRRRYPNDRNRRV